MRTARTLLLMSLLVLGVSGFGSRGPGEKVSVQDGSALWIEGASTVNQWTCSASTLRGSAAVSIGAPATTNDPATVQPEARLAVATRSFECGKERMNRDFLDALKAMSHPEIVFQLMEAAVVETPTGADDWYRLRVRGHLTIAGTTRVVETVALGRQLENGQFQLRGSKELTMTEFGVQPPVALLGLIKAKDQIEVHFDLRAAPQDMATL